MVKGRDIPLTPLPALYYLYRYMTHKSLRWNFLSSYVGFYTF